MYINYIYIIYRHIVYSRTYTCVHCRDPEPSWAPSILKWMQVWEETITITKLYFFRLCSYSPFSKSTWPQKIGVFHSTAEICHQSWRFNCRRKPRLGWKWGAGSILKYMKIDGLWAAATKSTRCPFKATRRWAKVKLWIGQKSDPKISKIGRGMLRAKGFGHFEH